MLHFFFHWLYNPLWLWPLLLQFHDHFTDSRTPWIGDHSCYIMGPNYDDEKLAIQHKNSRSFWENPSFRVLLCMKF
jgi:hypothetical protein